MSPSAQSISADERSGGRSAGIQSVATVKGTSLPSDTPTSVVSVVPLNAPNMWFSERFSSITYTTCLIGHRVSIDSGDGRELGVGDRGAVVRRGPEDDGGVVVGRGAPSSEPSAAFIPGARAPAAAPAPPATAARFRNVRRETESGSSAGSSVRRWLI